MVWPQNPTLPRLRRNNPRKGVARPVQPWLKSGTSSPRPAPGITVHRSGESMRLNRGGRRIMWGGLFEIRRRLAQVLQKGCYQTLRAKRQRRSLGISGLTSRGRRGPAE